MIFSNRLIVATAYVKRKKISLQGLTFAQRLRCKGDNPAVALKDQPTHL